MIGLKRLEGQAQRRAAAETATGKSIEHFLYSMYNSLWH